MKKRKRDEKRRKAKDKAEAIYRRSCCLISTVQRGPVDRIVERQGSKKARSIYISNLRMH